MVFYPNSINLTWIVDHNRSLSLNRRPQYNGLDLDDGLECKEAADIFDECNRRFEQPDCLEVIYLIYHLSPIDLDSTVFYDDGVFRFDQVSFSLSHSTKAASLF